MGHRVRRSLRGRSGTLALVGAGVLLAGGSSALTIAVTSQQHAPQPPADAAGVIDDTDAAGVIAGLAPESPSPLPSPAAVGPTPTPAARSTPSRSAAAPSASRAAAVAPATLAPAAPRMVRIPAIGVVSVVDRVGLAQDGAIAVPQPGPGYDHAAWFTGSPLPGQLGPSVIVGHVDSVSNGRSVFFRLGALRPRDRIDVTLADGVTASFTVRAVRSYAKQDFPTATVYGNTTTAQLRLITCGGSFEKSVGHYADNTVVFAEFAGTRGP